MTETLNFRSAFHGFNREDVVHYIEYLKSNHAAEIAALQAQLSSAEADTEAAEKLAHAEQMIDVLATQVAEYQTTVAQLETQLRDGTPEPAAEQPEAAPAEPSAHTDAEWDAIIESKIQAEFDRDAALEAKAQAEAERDAAREALAQAQAQLNAPRPLSSIGSSNTQRELEAYRRAERTERVARERAAEIYHTANGALADATALVDEAFTRIDGVSGQVAAQLEQLCAAVTETRQALADAANTLYSIRPEAQ